MWPRTARSCLSHRFKARPTKKAIVKTIQFYMNREVSDTRRGRNADPCPGWILDLFKRDYPEIFATEEVKAMEARHAENLEKAKRAFEKRLMQFFQKKRKGRKRSGLNS